MMMPVTLRKLLLLFCIVTYQIEFVPACSLKTAASTQFSPSYSITRSVTHCMVLHGLRTASIRALYLHVILPHISKRKLVKFIHGHIGAS